MGELFTPTHLIVLAFPVLFVVIPAWQIVKKAGYPAPLSLLLLVPFVNLAAIYIFAFSRWKVVPVPPRAIQEGKAY